jgi:hypothetical protein
LSGRKHGLGWDSEDSCPGETGGRCGVDVAIEEVNLTKDSENASYRSVRFPRSARMLAPDTDDDCVRV